MNKIRILIFTFSFSILSMNTAFAEIQEKALLKSIKDGQIELLIKFLDEGVDINATYGKENYTLLNYAIRNQNANAVKLLISRGADMDTSSKGKTPLINAVIKNNLMIMHYLIKGGANLDATIKKGNTALIIASKGGKLECIKMLVENGANVEWKNSNGLTALDFANMANYPIVAKYLVQIIEMRNYYIGLPNYTDGPHLEWKNDSTILMFYMTYDTTVDYFIKKEDYIIVNTDTTIIHGFAGDSLHYTVIRNLKDDPDSYNGVNKILAIGDIHGHYSALVEYLKRNNIIDNNLDWTWGDGHIVLLGDVFDRGNEVTESLWFIYKLDLMARLHGGRVHLLLGNHEVMVMMNDTRYLNRKYELFSNYFLRDYADFFSANSILGNWLRNRNAIIKINDCIFSHAGISPAILDRKLSINTINQMLREFLSSKPDTPNNNAEITSLLLNTQGPLWYRGYVLDGMGAELVNQKQVNAILKFYEAQKMIIAHTEVHEMQAMYQGKVIAIDVPIRTDTILPEALLIKNGKFFRLTINKKKVPCNFEITIGKED